MEIKYSFVALKDTGEKKKDFSLVTQKYITLADGSCYKLK